MKLSLADRLRRPTTMRQMREKVDYTSRGKPSLRTPPKLCRTPTKPASPSYYESVGPRDYHHEYIVLEDSLGAIRIDQHACGTVYVDSHYLSEGDGEVIRTERLRQGVDVGTLLRALVEKPRQMPSLFLVQSCPRCSLPVSEIQGVRFGMKLFHKCCLICDVCGKGGEGLINPHKSVYLHSSTCSKCSKCGIDVVEGDSFVFLGPVLLHHQCAPRCLACGGSVSGSEVLRCPKGWFHASCARCIVCGDVIAAADSPLTIVEGSHIAHRKCCSPCAVCLVEIFPTEECWETSVGTFHDQCFTCNECHGMLGQDHRLLSGAPYCVACYTRVTSLKMT